MKTKLGGGFQTPLIILGMGILNDVGVLFIIFDLRIDINWQSAIVRRVIIFT